MHVSDVMSFDTVTVTPYTLLKDAAIIMLEAQVSGLPVVDDGRLVGIITEADFVDRQAAVAPSARHRILGVLFGRREGRTDEATTVGEVMSTTLVTVKASDPVARAARSMVDNNVKRLPVVGEEGELVGVISRADVMRVFARADGEIESELEEVIHRGLLPVDPAGVRVSVTDGVVSLQGKVDARVDGDVLATLALHTDGVLGVKNSLDWDVDSRFPAPRFAAYPQEGKSASN